MSYIRILSGLLLVLLLTACGAAAPAAMEAPAEEAAETDLAFDGGSGETAPAAEGAPLEQNEQPVERLIIKNADLTLLVADVPAAEETITARVGQLQGYIVYAESSGTADRLQTFLTFRIPADSFDAALTSLEEVADEVLSRTVSGDDVTEEFVDLQSRLRTLEATQARLFEFLDEAATVEEALEVNRTLTEIEAEIELAKGRMQYLQQSAALSTVNVTLRQESAPPPPVTASWDPLTVFNDALEGLVVFGQALASLGIILLVWSPVWLPIVLLAAWLVRRITKSRTTSGTPRPPETGAGANTGTSTGGPSESAPSA